MGFKDTPRGTQYFWTMKNMLDAPILEWSLSPQEIYKDQNAKQHVVLRVVWVFEKTSDNPICRLAIFFSIYLSHKFGVNIP